MFFLRSEICHFYKVKNVKKSRKYYCKEAEKFFSEKLRIITEILIIIAKKLRIIAENVLLELSLYISRLAKLRLQDCQGKVTHDCEERKGALSGILGCMWHGIPWYSSKESVPQATANHYSGSKRSRRRNY